MPVITRLPPPYEEIDREREKKTRENDIRIAEWLEREHRSSLIRLNNSFSFRA
jgi:hypothetical protein